MINISVTHAFKAKANLHVVHNNSYVITCQIFYEHEEKNCWCYFMFVTIGLVFFQVGF
jgi:hypothetical protein